MNQKVLSIAFVSVLFGSVQSHGQTTFERVKAIFNNNCTTGCHSGTNPDGQLNLSGSVNEVYTELAGVQPVNPAAGNAGMKLVDPGYPERSFLFVKISADIDPVDHLIPAMGTPMPQNQSQLPYKEIELVRQWILYGADTVSDYVDPQLLEDFYAGEGMARIEPLPAPDPEDGFQIHYGPFFLAPLQEEEYFYKYDTKLPSTVEVNRIETLINEESHHTALYRYYPEADTNFLPGLRPVQNVLVAAGVYYTSDIIGQWPNSQDLVLPEGTAFRFPENVVVDLNYHIPNYSSDSILAAEFYMNVYTQPEGAAQQEMISAPMYYGGADPTGLVIPNNTVDSIYTFATYETDTAYTWYIWSIMAHTHQLGQDYQVWRRNPDGSKGENVYNGHYDATYSFDQGFYDWQHPPFRTFDDELLEVDFTEGLIHEAQFSNQTGNTVYFGLQTTDEMYVTYIQYVQEPITIGVKENGGVVNPLKVYPNPTNDVINLAFDLNSGDDFEVIVVNELGQQIYNQTYGSVSGRQRVALSKDEIGLADGLYFIQVNAGSQRMATKVVIY